MFSRSKSNRFKGNLFLDNKNNIYSEFEEVVNNYEKKVFRLLFSLTNNTEEAKDLAQETFIRAFKKFHCFKGKSDLYTWLYRIAVNCWKNKLRYDKRHSAPEQQHLDTTPTYPDQNEDKNKFVIDHEDLNEISPEKIAENVELQEFIKRCIHSLSPKYKISITLYLEGLSLEEISKITESRIGTIKSLVFRAKLILKEEITKYLK